MKINDDMKKAITTDMETHISAVTNLLSISFILSYTLKARCKALCNGNKNSYVIVFHIKGGLNLTSCFKSIVSP